VNLHAVEACLDGQCRGTAEGSNHTLNFLVAHGAHTVGRLLAAVNLTVAAGRHAVEALHQFLQCLPPAVVQLKNSLGALPFDECRCFFQTREVFCTYGLRLSGKGLALGRHQCSCRYKQSEALGPPVQKCTLCVGDMPVSIRGPMGHRCHDQSVSYCYTVIQCIWLKNGLNVHCLYLF